LTPRADVTAWRVRLFGASGEARNATLKWSGPAVGKTFLSNLAEEELSLAPNEIAVAGWDLVTLRVERT
jgi:hypothetical protein